MKFWKMHGLGNDFMVVDARAGSFEAVPEEVRGWADRRRGVGFDQLLVLVRPSDDADAGYRIFNADGLEAEQCGNGMRCLALWLHQEDGLPATGELSGAGGRIAYRVDPSGQVSVTLPAAEVEGQEAAPDNGEQLVLVDVGNPHAVMRVDRVASAPVAERGAALESALGRNIGFMEVVDRGHIRLRVFERGAGETEACGSGACAAVAAGNAMDWLDANVEVELPGGVLKIGLNDPGGVRLTGPAEFAYAGEL